MRRVPRSVLQGSASSWRFLLILVGLSPLQVFPPRQPLGDLLLEAKSARLIERATPQFVRQILLRDVCLRNIVCVLIPRVVPQFLHQLGRRIPDVQGYTLGWSLAGRS